MPKSVTSLFWMAVAGLLWLGTPAHAMEPALMPPPGGMMRHRMLGEGPGMMLPLILRHAHLTTDQKTQVRKIMQADHAKLRTLFTQLHAANAALADKLFAPGPVQAKDLAPQVEQIAKLRQQLLEQGLQTMLAVRAVLTPQQLAQAKQLRDRMERLRQELHNLLQGP
jgi:periplasmic protein CpxP/Spy